MSKSRGTPAIPVSTEAPVLRVMREVMVVTPSNETAIAKVMRSDDLHA